jgi:hypothetical protein
MRMVFAKETDCESYIPDTPRQVNLPEFRISDYGLRIFEAESEITNPKSAIRSVGPELDGSKRWRV